MTRRAIALAAALILAGVGAGCAKDEAAPLVAPSGTTPPLSQRDYLEQANKVCKEADARIIELIDKAGPVHNATGGQASADLQAVVNQMVPIAENAIAHLQSLTPPAEDRALADRAVARIRSNLDAARQDPNNQIDPIGSADPELYAFGLYSCFTKG